MGASGGDGATPPVNLPGGYINEVVRVGDTVRRSTDTDRGGVHELLRFLEEADYPAPRFRGLDEQGRETLTFVEGHVPHGNQHINAVTEHRGLAAVAGLVRELHDLTAGSCLAGDAEVVCHNDLSPKNTVYNTDAGWWRPVAFIDWDLAGPGRRIHDVAQVCWQYLSLGPSWDDDPARAGRLLRLVCDAYESPHDTSMSADQRRASIDAAWSALDVIDRSELVPTIVWWQQRCADGIDRGAAAGDPAMKALRQHGALEEVRAPRVEPSPARGRRTRGCP
jgi:hypothetical protein